MNLVWLLGSHEVLDALNKLQPNSSIQEKVENLQLIADKCKACDQIFYPIEKINDIISGWQHFLIEGSAKNLYHFNADQDSDPKSALENTGSGSRSWFYLLRFTDFSNKEKISNFLGSLSRLFVYYVIQR